MQYEIAQPIPTIKYAQCPSCNHRTRFHYLGEQRWPQRYAGRKGFSTMRLWNCTECHTTISERSG